MKKIFIVWGSLFIFGIFTMAIFSPYFFQGKVPFAGNLLVSFYQPWKSYTWGNYSTNGPANKPIGFDTLRIFYPYRSLTTQTLKAGNIPLWNPYAFSGNMYLAAYQTAVFHPLTPLFLILPTLDAWSLMVILAPFLTALFTYYFLRSLQLSKKASLVGALSFGFGGIVVAFTEEWYIASYSIVFLPLILLGIKKLSQRTSARYFILLTLSIVGSILSGWFQMTFYTLILAFFWTLYLLWKKKNKKWSLLILMSFVLSLILSSAYLLPNIQAYFYSSRGTSDAKYVFDLYLLPLSRLITYLVPDFFGNPATYTYFGEGFYQEKILYVGTVGLLFGLYALLRRKQISTTAAFFAISWIISLSLGFSLPSSWFVLYYLHIPLLSTLVPSRIIIVAAFCLSVLAAFGIDAYFQEKNNKKTFITSGALGIVLLSGWMFTLFYKWKHPLDFFARISLKNMIVPSLFFALLFILLFLNAKYKIKQHIFFALLLLVTLIPLFYFAHKYLYFSERAFTFPTPPVFAELQKIQENNRFWSFGDGYVPTNVASFYHLYSVEGYDSFYIQKYGELLDASANNGTLSKNAPRVDANMVTATSIQEVLGNPYRMKLLNFLGVKYILALPSEKDKKFLAENPQSPIQPTWTDGKYVIYKNTISFSRAFFVDSYHVDTTKAEEVADFFSPHTSLATTVLFSKSPRKEISSIPLAASATIQSYQPEHISIKTNSNKSAFLVLSDNYYPGWTARIDGKASEIYQADYTFRAIWVPTGKHMVVFDYHPQIFIIGVAVSGIGLLIFLLISFTLKVRNI